MHYFSFYIQFILNKFIYDATNCFIDVQFSQSCKQLASYYLAIAFTCLAVRALFQSLTSSKYPLNPISQAFSPRKNELEFDIVPLATVPFPKSLPFTYVHAWYDLTYPDLPFVPYSHVCFVFTTSVMCVHLLALTAEFAVQVPFLF